jgi:hypothetical protein
MLRNAVVHLANEQPFMVDLLVPPTPADSCLVCRNMRTMSGKKPVWVDNADSTFLVPVAQIRFVEIPATSYVEAAADGAAAPATGRTGETILDESLPGDLSGATTDAVDAAVWGSEQASEGQPAGLDEDLDGDLMRRIREA